MNLNQDAKELATQILNHFNSIIIYPIEDYASKKRPLTLPTISTSDVQLILETITTIFNNEDIILDVPPNTVVIGDLHGHILDLLRLLRHYKSLIRYNYLFLGDLVDRGQFSLETTILIFALKIVHPNKIWIIRGNHEFSSIYSYSGFLEDLHRLFPTNISTFFAKAFSMMPLAAIIDKYAFCIHGGLGPSITSIKDIASLERPIETFKSEIVNDLVWSDPVEDPILFFPSSRGSGHLFGSEAVNAFLSGNDLKLLVRGHECINQGFSFTNNSQVLTIFSASSYCGQNNNSSGSVLFLFDRQYKPCALSPLPYLLRQDVEFNLMAPRITPHLVRPPSFSSEKNLLSSSVLQHKKIGTRMKRVVSDNHIMETKPLKLPKKNPLSKSRVINIVFT